MAHKGAIMQSKGRVVYGSFDHWKVVVKKTKVLTQKMKKLELLYMYIDVPFVECENMQIWKDVYTAN